MARKSDYEINSIILNRWSPRAMSGESINENELMPLFEAARWAPSSMNNQLWRFIYAKRNTKYWDGFFDLLMEGNRQWCKDAAALVILISRKNSYHKDTPQVTHSLEAGAAFENLALEGSSRGLVVHGMAGFDYERARTELKVPEGYEVCMMFAIGKSGDKNSLSEDLQKAENVTDRNKVTGFVFEGEM